ncbi:hypothetical protein DMENIID0001_058190 [Sergentomyia squamirostris]
MKKKKCVKWRSCEGRVWESGGHSSDFKHLNIYSRSKITNVTKIIIEKFHVEIINDSRTFCYLDVKPHREHDSPQSEKIIKPTA